MLFDKNNNHEEIVVSTLRNIEGLAEAKNQDERDKIYEAEKDKSFRVFMNTHGCPFGEPDNKLSKVKPEKITQEKVLKTSYV